MNIGGFTLLEIEQWREKVKISKKYDVKNLKGMSNFLVEFASESMKCTDLEFYDKIKEYFSKFDIEEIIELLDSEMWYKLKRSVLVHSKEIWALYGYFYNDEDELEGLDF